MDFNDLLSWVYQQLCRLWHNFVVFIYVHCISNGELKSGQMVAFQKNQYEFGATRPNRADGRLKGKARKKTKAAVVAANQPATIIKSEPTAASTATTLHSRCAVCSTRDDLSFCVGCKVVQYCSKNHRKAHKRDHQAACNKIKRAQSACAQEEERLRNLLGDLIMPPNPLEDSVTRPYMQYRSCLIEALSEIKTLEAVQTAYDNGRDTLRLNRSDVMGIRNRVPSLLMRLGRDQDAYDFLSWWLNVAERDDYDWEPESPFLDIVNADIFESIDLACGRFTSLSKQVDLTLLKIRTLLDLQAMQSLNTNTIGLMRKFKLPLEVVNRVRDFVPKNSIISGNNTIMKREDHSSLIEKLEEQIHELFTAVKHNNPYFWSALLNPGEHLAAPPAYTTSGSFEEVQFVLQLQHMRSVLRLTIDAWTETPGALEMIKLLTLGMRMGPMGETPISPMPGTWVEEGSVLRN